MAFYRKGVLAPASKDEVGGAAWVTAGRKKQLFRFTVSRGWAWGWNGICVTAPEQSPLLRSQCRCKRVLVLAVLVVTAEMDGSTVERQVVRPPCKWPVSLPRI